MRAYTLAHSSSPYCLSSVSVCSFPRDVGSLLFHCLHSRPSFVGFGLALSADFSGLIFFPCSSAPDDSQAKKSREERCQPDNDTSITPIMICLSPVCLVSAWFPGLSPWGWWVGTNVVLKWFWVNLVFHTALSSLLPPSRHRWLGRPLFFIS